MKRTHIKCKILVKHPKLSLLVHIVMYNIMVQINFPYHSRTWKATINSTLHTLGPKLKTRLDIIHSLVIFMSKVQMKKSCQIEFKEKNSTKKKWIKNVFLYPRDLPEILQTTQNILSLRRLTRKKRTWQAKLVRSFRDRGFPKLQ